MCVFCVCAPWMWVSCHYYQLQGRSCIVFRCHSLCSARTLSSCVLWPHAGASEHTLHQFFVNRVRTNLHVMLVLDYRESELQSMIVKFPKVFHLSSIDVVDDWDAEARIQVGCRCCWYSDTVILLHLSHGDQYACFIAVCMCRSWHVLFHLHGHHVIHVSTVNVPITHVHNAWCSALWGAPASIPRLPAVSWSPLTPCT